MRVTADGEAHPIADMSSMKPIHITIRRRSDDASLPSDGFGIGGFDSRYVVLLEGGNDQPFTTEAADQQHSGVQFRFPVPSLPLTQKIGLERGLKGVEAIYWLHAHIHGILSLRPADKDWVFFVYSGDLMTDAEARRINIEGYGPPRYHAQAEAEVDFLTGPCIRDE
jgi:hypothetical protein